MKTKLAFKIGDWVTATHSVEFVYETDQPEQPIDDSVNGYLDDHRIYHRRIHKTEHRIVGQIVGGVTRMLGQYYYSSGGGPDEGPGPPYLSVKSTVFVYLVREGFTNRPRECLPEDLSAIEPRKNELPMRKCNQPPCDERYRELLRDIAKELPRVNGKFVKAAGVLR